MSQLQLREDLRRAIRRAADAGVPWRSIASALDDEKEAAEAHADVDNEPEED